MNSSPIMLHQIIIEPPSSLPVDDTMSCNWYGCICIGAVNDEEYGALGSLRAECIEQSGTWVNSFKADDTVESEVLRRVAID